MGIRRFVNLLVANRTRCTYSLRRFDLSQNQFFYDSPEELASHGRVLPIQKYTEGSAYSPLKRKKANDKNKKQLAASDIGTIRLPAPFFTMRPTPCRPGKPGEHQLDVFALSERKIMLADRHRRVLSYDADSHCALTMPWLHAPKTDPLTVSIPGSQQDDGEGSIYIIERMLWPESQRSFQFEALVSDRFHAGGYHPFGTWGCQAFQLPPTSLSKRALVCCAAAVGNAICVSISGAGTYCFDRASHAWSHAGDWMMPFFGTPEYVPELNLWFGISGRDFKLPCAADLSPVARGQPPEPALFWGHDDHLPEEWHYRLCTPSQMVSLGSGKFCILRYLETRIPCPDEVIVDNSYAVFTGLEVLAGNGKKHGLRMVSHKSRRCRNPQANSIQRLL
ncbi:uncharacterized protein LOC100834465 [Brachypodium distachyon]|uniref:DUF1618 domain-containing protein n=1 Tax=Brachypodium distachyon TaxID=15368 RepID=I1H8G1_BRADI|nr:uncharacterized protein LOC100834465 [Brachypodium distachyon]KQK23051.1 hypothetical protein BRADI_1g70990v3 [Brachypodium distachyon]|eukprot:XP_003561933.1 uncharacterized protein LOC100834465 [Brachypodium distachyon]